MASCHKYNTLDLICLLEKGSHELSYSFLCEISLEDINRKEDGKLAIKCACQYGNEEEILLLIAFGADPSLESNCYGGGNAIDYCKTFGARKWYVDCLNILQGGQLNAKIELIKRRKWNTDHITFDEWIRIISFLEKKGGEEAISEFKLKANAKRESEEILRLGYITNKQAMQLKEKDEEIVILNHKLSSLTKLEATTLQDHNLALSNLNMKCNLLANTNETLTKSTENIIQKYNLEIASLNASISNLNTKYMNLSEHKDSLITEHNLQIAAMNTKLNNLNENLAYCENLIGGGYEIREKGYVGSVDLDSMHSMINELASMNEKLTAEAELKAKKFQEAKECSVCLDHQSNIVLIPCGHIVTCDKCAPRLRPSQCPMCRAVFTTCHRVFLPY